ncbi:endoglucanase [Streptomyces sp. SID4919]|uniref:glycoside hydrolase family 6 protein n=1 Tax=Streptomyces TaxID=1883 RepID=UPI000823D1D7|nr:MULTISPECIES: glycoside hydrolase family 6 protein [Streptomyces]MCX4664068.1 glycoside hydrolase family 6 protein [Streptomyces uncialis]MYY10760.1 endoglucanase [Streptomyces sp. SID4919]WTE15562.1 glycoside hydrolase family 6 protein [Streptomyces uncialis]SCK60553.1 endoglucanase [Streptomyces sp. AmelKG-E11A]
MYGKVRASAAVAGAVLLLMGCSSGGSDSGGDKPEPMKQQPKDKDPYWVNPEGYAADQVAAYENDGKDREAEQIRKIAAQPTADWIGVENPEEETRGITQAAQKADRDALLVLYNIPHRDCGQYSGGGAADGDAYRAWIDGVVKGIGDRPTTVVLEPDAVLHLVDGCTPKQFHEERYHLLWGAVEKLKSSENTKVYVDAGNAGWGKPDQIFEPLKRAGVEKADGFSVNVSNFYSTADSVKYGKELSAKVGGRPFVIDTSRNGNGPFTGGNPDERWCNPPGRALGETPTTKTGDPLVHAFLWVKRPGESDGECKGGPKAGAWWPEYALELAKSSKG